MNCRHGIDTTADYCSDCAVSDLNSQLAALTEQLATLKQELESVQAERDKLRLLNDIHCGVECIECSGDTLSCTDSLILQNTALKAERDRYRNVLKWIMEHWSHNTDCNVRYAIKEALEVNG